VAEAEINFREALAMRKRLLGDEDVAVARSLSILACLLEVQGKLDQAETMHRESLAIHRKSNEANSTNVVVSLNRLGQVLRKQGKFPEAKDTFRQGAAILKALPDKELEFASALMLVADVLKDQENWPEAETTLAEAYTITKSSLGLAHAEVTRARGNLLWTLHMQGKFAEAEPLLLEVYEVAQSNPKADSDERRQAIERLSNFYVEWAAAAPGSGKLQKAMEWRQKLGGLAPLSNEQLK
jgi:tetratricopeptide (TPR) repeat protein